jgi:ribosome modulation factor
MDMKRPRVKMASTETFEAPKSQAVVVSEVPFGRTKEWQEGWNASRSGVIRSKCPYSTGTIEANSWTDGWISKFHGEHI